MIKPATSSTWTGLIHCLPEPSCPPKRQSERPSQERKRPAVRAHDEADAYQRHAHAEPFRAERGALPSRGKTSARNTGAGRAGFVERVVAPVAVEADGGGVDQQARRDVAFSPSAFTKAIRSCARGFRARATFLPSVQRPMMDSPARVDERIDAGKIGRHLPSAQRAGLDAAGREFFSWHGKTPRSRRSVRFKRRTRCRPMKTRRAGDADFHAERHGS